MMKIWTLKKEKHLPLYASLSLIIGISISALSHPDLIRKRMLEVITLLIKSFLPSLFPFMILSSIAVQLLLQEDTIAMNRKAKKANSFPVFSFLISILFGFPIGANVVSELYNSARVSKGRAERYFPLFNQCSFAYVTLVLGRNFLGSFAVGIRIYAVAIISALLVFFLFRKGENDSYSQGFTRERERSSLVKIIRGATLNMLYISGFLIAFSIPCAIVECYFGKGFVTSLLSSILELSAGCGSIIHTFPSSSPFTIPLLCATISFGGLCVGMQSQLCLGDSPISMKEYYIRKIYQAIVAFFLGFFIG